MQQYLLIFAEMTSLNVNPDHVTQASELKIALNYSATSVQVEFTVCHQYTE